MQKLVVVTFTVLFYLIGVVQSQEKSSKEIIDIGSLEIAGEVRRPTIALQTGMQKQFDLVSQNLVRELHKEIVEGDMFQTQESKVDVYLNNIKDKVNLLEKEFLE